MSDAQKLSPMQLWIRSLVLALIYFGVAKLSLRLAYFHPSAAPIWPPVALSLAALLVWDTRLWPGVFIGAFLANLTTLGTVWTSLGIATGNSLEAWAGATLVLRYANGTHAFEKPATIFRFTLLAGLLSPLLSSVIGVSMLCASGYAEWAHFADIWLIWWVGDMTSTLTVTPLLLLMRSPIRKRWPWARFAEALLFVAVLLASCWAVFYFPVGYLCVPLAVWAAFRFGEREAVSSSILFAIFGTCRIISSHASLIPSSHNDLLRFQCFIAVVTLTGLVLASLVTEQQRRDEVEREGNRQALRASEKRYHQLLQANIIGTMIVDWEGRVLEANDAFLTMLGYTRQDLRQGLVGGPALTPSEYHATDEWIRSRLRETGSCPTVDKEYYRKDGTRIPVLVGVVFQEEPEHHLVCLVIDSSERRMAMDALRKAHDEMETRVALRTEELASTNRNLVREIDRRRRAESALQNLAITDPLTGLYNRRGFKTLADQLLKQARRERRHFTFYLADLDGLKRINDTFGHMEGDQAVVAAAAVLKDTFRSSDVVARFGGDEFAIATIEDSEDTAHPPYLKRLQEKLEEYNHSAGKDYALNLSVGLATLEPGVKCPIEQLIETADKELYENKRIKKLNVIYPA